MSEVSPYGCCLDTGLDVEAKNIHGRTREDLATDRVRLRYSTGAPH